MWGVLHREILSLVAMADAACPDPVAEADHPKPEAVNVQTIFEAITEVLQGQDLAKILLGELRRQTSAKLGLPLNALDARREEIKEITQRLAQGSPGEQGQSATVQTPLEMILVNSAGLQYWAEPTAGVWCTLGGSL